MDITDAAFEEEFSFLGHSIGSDAEIFDKLREICSVHTYDAATVCEHWMAFIHSKKKPNMKISVENLDLMEREFQKSKAGSKLNKGSKNSTKVNPMTVYNVNSLQNMVRNDADDLLGAYSTPNSKSAKKRQHTPDMVQNKRLTGMSRSPAVPFSPSSFSPSVATPSQKYRNRGNSGEVTQSFGASSKVNWKSKRTEICKVQQYDQTTGLSDRFKYMFQKMADKAHVLNDLIEDVGETLKAQYNTGDFSHVALPAQDMVTACGRVCCDSNGKLNAQSVVLEGSRQTSAGKQIAVDLSGIQHYSLFPGQIVAVDGINSTGNKLVVKKVYENVMPPPASINNLLTEGDLTVVVAAGPFTTSDNTDFEPLRDLLKEIKDNRPDVIVLLGPFVDVKNPDLEKNYCSRSFEEYFMEQIHIITESTEIKTRVVILPSQRDACSDYVYPQPPFKLKFRKDQTPENIYFASDPCTLTIDGVVFAITSTDILFHLGAEEIYHNPPGPTDRLARLTKSLLTQHSFYPLYPPSEEVNIDYELFEEHARLPVKPHVLILPSDLKQFIKNIDDCCCINPGRLARGQVGGTFTRLHISSPRHATAESFTSLVAAEVVRI